MKLDFARNCAASGRCGTHLRRHDAEDGSGGLPHGNPRSTRGETGTRGTPETRLKERSAREKSWAPGCAGISDCPTLTCECADEQKEAIAAVIRELEPHTVILPYWEGRHPDHYTAATLGWEACFVAGLKNYALAGEAFRPFKIIYAASYADVRPTFAIDITAQYDRRRRAILAYESQFRPPKRDRRSKVSLPLDELEAWMSDAARHYGRMIGVKYAEGFVVKEVMRADDVVKLPVRSM